MPESEKCFPARPYHHGRLREAAIAAALDVLARHEPSAVSLRDLARTIGVRHSALYVHFRDRSALLAAVAGAGFNVLIGEMDAARRMPGSPVAHLAASYVQFARRNPAYYRVMFLPEVSQPDNIGYIKEACERCFGILLEVLTQESDLAPDAVHERAVGVWSTLHGFVLLGDNGGPLHHQISADKEVAVATRIVLSLTSARQLDR